jgi:hypothetical protein
MNTEIIGLYNHHLLNYRHKSNVGNGRGILYRYVMLGRTICEKYQSRDEKFPEPNVERNLVSRLSCNRHQTTTPSTLLLVGSCCKLPLRKRSLTLSIHKRHWVLYLMQLAGIPFGEVVLFSLLVSQSLYCLSFNLRLLIIFLVSSSFSYVVTITHVLTRQQSMAYVKKIWSFEVFCWKYTIILKSTIVYQGNHDRNHKLRILD